LRRQLAEEEHDYFVPKTEWDEKAETNDFINTFASRVEHTDHIKSAGRLENKITNLKKNYDPHFGTEDEREEAQEHIKDQEAKLATLKKQIQDDKVAEAEAEDDYEMKETKIAALKDSIAQLQSQEQDQRDEITRTTNQIGHVVEDPIAAANENEEYNRVHAIAE
jgi:chromosome segregation ATPase